MDFRHYIAIYNLYDKIFSIILPSGTPMNTLTLQLYVQGQWHDAALLSVANPQQGLRAGCTLGYISNYLVDCLEKEHTALAWSLSANLPLGWAAYANAPVWAALQDIIPAGAARRFLEQRYGQQRPADMAMDVFLLAQCTPAPIGHLRIKESAELIATAPALGFSRDSVVRRDNHFLEYAYEQGAAIGGATGAGGEAPKLLLTEAADGLLYADASLADEHAVTHWFIKFPRHTANATDQDILRSEYCYYRAIHQLGFSTVEQSGLTLEEMNKPSLWMRRFDRRVENQQVQRFAVESIYSLLEVTEPGSYLQHVEVLKRLIRLWRAQQQESTIADLVLEYLRRDLLNHVLGNSDNHGRNTSIIRGEQSIALAPIYDLAPMVMDDEGITRTTKWPQTLERGGQVDWLAVCQLVGELADLTPEWLYQQLRDTAQELLALPDLLLDLGLPERTWQHPRVPLRHLQRQFTLWGLC